MPNLHCPVHVNKQCPGRICALPVATSKCIDAKKSGPRFARGHPRQALLRIDAFFLPQLENVITVKQKRHNSSTFIQQHINSEFFRTQLLKGQVSIETRHTMAACASTKFGDPGDPRNDKFQSMAESTHEITFSPPLDCPPPYCIINKALLRP